MPINIKILKGHTSTQKKALVEKRTAITSTLPESAFIVIDAVRNHDFSQVSALANER